MLLPALSKAREKAKDTHCVSNLKQIMMAELLYAQDYNDLVTSWLSKDGASVKINGWTFGPNTTTQI